MRNISRTFILFGLLLSSLPATAAEYKGSGRISGIIKSISGNPLGNAVVTIIRDIQQGERLSIAKSDSRGFFKSASLKPGTYYLRVSREGYEPVTTTKFFINAGHTTSLDIILQDFLDLISDDNDPRNWPLKTVMRSTSDRRLIFRQLPGGGLQRVDAGSSAFYRNGTMNIASGTDGENYVTRPQASQAGVRSNFAFAEPLTQHSRMILSGQLDFGHGAFWRIRNTYNYRPNKDHDYKVSVGYGQMNVNYPGSSSISSQMLSQESGRRDSGMQTLAFGLEGNTNFLDLMSIKYGIDYSRLHNGNSRGFFYPSIQILVRPFDGWNIRTSIASRRISDADSVSLPDGEILNLAEPTLITFVGNRVTMSQVRHSEVSAERELTDNTAIEIAVYRDLVRGPGLPIMITTITPVEKTSQVMQMREDNAGQRGMKVTVKQKVSENFSASVAYVFGDAVSISGMDGIVLSQLMDGDMAAHLRQRSQHSITGRINATIPATRTNVQATTRWYSGNPLTPVDWFSDRMDIGTKSTNLEIRQSIPLPEFVGTGRWEVLLDLRNMLNQGREVLPTSDGEIVLNRNPRSLRFGLSLSFK